MTQSKHIFLGLRYPMLVSMSIIHYLKRTLRISPRSAANTAMCWKNDNLRSDMKRPLRRTGMSGWPQLFHSIQTCRQTVEALLMR